MALRTLIVCSDSRILQLAVPVLDGCRIDSDVCTSVDLALRRWRRAKYDAILLDCAIAESPALLEHVHERGFNRGSLLVAIVSGPIEAREAGRCGANVVLRKPLTQEAVVHALRALYGLMVSERRRYYRHPVHFPITITTDTLPELIAMAVDLSQGGMAIHSVLPVAQKGKVLLRFRLPSSDRVLTAESEIRWTRSDRIGLEFVRMPRRDREELVSWLGDRYAAADAPSPIPAVVPTSL